MLRLSELIVPLIIHRLIITRVSSGKASRTEVFHTLRLRFEVAASKAVVDSLIVFGISFFSSFIALGYDNPMVNIKLSLFSAFTMSGLTFFSELKAQMRKK